MKQTKHLVLALFALLGFSPTMAETVSPYTVDFNTTITTSKHDFTVASNWGHIVPASDYDGYGPYYMTYSYKSEGGINGTGALDASRQYAGDYSGGETITDLLVTPTLSGEVSIYAKPSNLASSSNPAFIEFYTLNESATAKDAMIGERILVDGLEDSDVAGWKKVSITLESAKKIGIRLQYVTVDNFSAASAEIEAQTSLSVANVANLEGNSGTSGATTYFSQQADGKLKVQLQVTLQNTGDVDFVAGSTENYTLTLATNTYSSGSKTYYEDAKVAIPENIAAGETKKFDVDFYIPYTTGWKNYYVREDVTGTTSSAYRYAGVTAYESKFVFGKKDGSESSSLSAAISFGMISETTTLNYEIRNTGIAPLTVNSITVPEGYTTNDITLPLILNGGEKQELDITLSGENTGAFSGNLTINYTSYGAETATNYELGISGNVLAEGTWSTTFEAEGDFAFPYGSVAENGVQKDYAYSNGAYNYYLKSYTSSSYANENNKFITPKLHANAGDKLTFDVARDGSSSSYNMKVYISTDRKNWGEAVLTIRSNDEGISSSFVNKEISFEEAGDYYVAFAIYGMRLDNIVGLKAVEVAHDLYIKEVKWPDASIKNGTSLQKPTIDIYPLTNETADAYTVKYVCGETVLAEANAIDLTASANSYKSFTFSWTPSVETTTLYEGTKIVFEFTDGTKFESDPFDLTVTNEPIFHFVNSIPSSKYYEPTDLNTPIAFGKTNAADVKSFYIYNWGPAPLTVKSVSLPEGFTSNITEQTVVAAFDENHLDVAAKQIDITFSAAEAGNYSGNLVITYLNGAGEDQTFELAISGTKLDPTKFYANFDNPSANSVVWPAGSVYQSNVSASTSNYSAPYNYYISSTSTIDNMFITPKLKANENEKILFDAKLYNGSWKEGAVKVYIAETRDKLLAKGEEFTLTPIYYISGEDEAADATMTTDYQTFEATIPTAGEYYIGFQISNRSYIDEIYGLSQVAIAHDWVLGDVTIPASATQNTPATATINISNFGLAAEEAGTYSIIAYVDGEATEVTGEVAIPTVNKFGTTTALTATFKSPKAGTFPVYFVVKSGSYFVKTAAQDVEFVKEELASEIGGETNGTTGEVPLYLNYKNSESVTLYTSEDLAAMGLKNGAKIKTITYKGYKTTDVQTTSFQVYYQWTDNQTLSQPETTYPYSGTEGMIKLIDEDHTWNKVGSSSELGDMIVLDFSSNPLVYEAGKSLKIYMHSYVDGYKTAYFEKSTLSSNNCYTRKADAATLTSSWSKITPAAIHLSLVAEPAALTGTVYLPGGTTPAEGATVTLTSTDGNNIQYSGVTAADGTYSIDVIQNTLSYNVKATLDGYKAANSASPVSDFSAPLNLTLAEEETITLADSDNGIVDAEDVTVAVTRPFIAGWNAIVLPFDITASEVTSKFDSQAEVAEYVGDEGTEEVAIKFSKVSVMKAGVPYLIWLSAAPADEIEFTGKNVKAELTPATGDNFDLVGVYTETDINAGDYFVKGGQFVKATANNKVKPYRSYLKAKTSGVRSIKFVVNGEEVTSINGLTIAESDNDAQIYNINGQKMNGKLRKGLYIINGKKMIVR